MKDNIYLGIDVGASGIKGALVDIKKGVLVSERFRLPTPKPSTPKAVAQIFAEVAAHFDWKDKPIGCGFPAVVRKGVVYTAANISEKWIGEHVEKLFSKYTNCPVFVRNDADVAGIAEMNLGTGKSNKDQGTVLIITLGTGLGSAVFINGELIPNTELGHFYLKGHNKVVEQYASDGARKRLELSWKNWATRLDKFLNHLVKLFSPDLIILGGGSSKKFDKYNQHFTAQVDIRPALLLNNAGIIGAALHAKQQSVLIKDATLS